MRFQQSFLVILVGLTLCLFSVSQATAAEKPEVIYGQSLVQWVAPDDGGAVLAIAGPDGLYLRQEFPAGTSPSFSLLNGEPRPDGVYKWELVTKAANGLTQSGWFEIRGGKVVAEEISTDKPPVVVEDGAPANSLYIDRDGRLGAGTSVPEAQLHVKGADAALAIEDTQTGGHSYILRSHEPGDGSLGLLDETSGKSRWLVDSEGKVGINTTKPTSTLTVDGYIESTKGFLVNGRPLPAVGGLFGTTPLSTESTNNNLFGNSAGSAITTGNFNSFFGASSGSSDTTGSHNSFFGYYAGKSTTTGYENTFVGRSAGEFNTTGHDNSYFGDNAGRFTTEGTYNAMFGGFAGLSTTTGGSNCFFGREAGQMNTTGNRNIIIGRQAGMHNTIENNNTLLGASADLDPGSDPSINPLTNATALGYRSYVSRSNALVLGGVKGFNSVLTETFVGIGTPNPDRQLVVEGSQAVGKFRRYSSIAPDFGPAFLFERARGANNAQFDIEPGDYLGKVQFRGRVGAAMLEYGALTFISSDTSQNGRFSFVDRDLVTERMVVLNTGNVGIGTTAPTERLDVAGNLRVRGSIVYGAPAVAVPDYVFEPDFKLMPIAELEQYLAREKHLPNVPNASEIKANGVNLGEFQMKLLEKVEELTLYTVEQKNTIDRQEKRIEALEAMLKQLLAEKAVEK